jgi:hypothetical protein
VRDSVRYLVRDSVRCRAFDSLMRANRRASNRFLVRAAGVAPLAVAALLAGCSEPAETASDRRAEDIVATIKIGGPLLDAVDRQHAWVPLNGALYTHRADFDALRQWYDELPERFDCDQIETVGLDGPPPREGSMIWTLRCFVDDGDYQQVISATTTIIDGEAATSVGAYHEPRS